MEKLKEIINNIKKIESESNIHFSPDVILDCAVRIYNSGNINKSGEIKPPFTTNSSSPATQKQKDLLYKLNVDFNAEDLTKIEAKKIIEEELQKQKWNTKKNYTK